jgi:hypothetical protein
MHREPDQVVHCHTLSGESITLCMYQEPGKMVLKTADGKEVRWLDHGHYQVVETTLEFFSESPHAP